jgi:hypothetical protein
MMTLNRYLLVGKENAPWLIKTAKLEFKWVIRGSVLVCALINIGHGWEYRAVRDLTITLYVQGLDQNYDVYIQANGGSYSDYPEANTGMPYFIYSIVYFVINFLFFFILNTAVEVKIVRRMHKELKDKRERMAKMSDSKAPISSSALTEEKSQSNENKKKLEAEEEDSKKERKVIKMVVFNGVLNIVLRAPDIFFWIENKTFCLIYFQNK